MHTANAVTLSFALLCITQVLATYPPYYGQRPVGVPRAPAANVAANVGAGFPNPNPNPNPSAVQTSNASAVINVVNRNVAGPAAGVPGPAVGVPGPAVGVPGPAVGVPGPAVGVPGPAVGAPGPAVGASYPDVGFPGPERGDIPDGYPYPGPFYGRYHGGNGGYYGGNGGYYGGYGGYYGGYGGYYGGYGGYYGGNRDRWYNSCNYYCGYGRRCIRFLNRYRCVYGHGSY